MVVGRICSGYTTRKVDFTDVRCYYFSMTTIRYVEDVFTEFAHAVDLRQISVQPQDIPAINSFQNVILTSKPLTKAQSSFVLKILTKYRIGSKMAGIDYHDSIDNPTWRYPFRVIDHSRSVSVDCDEDGSLRILMKFPYQIKEAFEKELPNIRSMWDSTLMSRVIKLKDANVIVIREFCEKYEFVLDQTFIDLCDSVEEIWNQEENFLPYSVVKNNSVELINATDDAKEYFEINKTDSLEENMFLAKSMNFCLKLEEKNPTLIQKIATAQDNYFYTNNVKNLFEILKSLPTAKVAVLVDRASETLNFVKNFVNFAENVNFPKNEIRVCFRLSAEEDRELKFNQWIKENQINGPVNSGRIYIFRHKPAKWLFADEENVKIIVTNGLFTNTNISISHWMDSHPCVIFVGEQKPAMRALSNKEKKIVNL